MCCGASLLVRSSPTPCPESASAYARTSIQFGPRCWKRLPACWSRHQPSYLAEHVAVDGVRRVEAGSVNIGAVTRKQVARDGRRITDDDEGGEGGIVDYRRHLGPAALARQSVQF